MQSLLNRLDSSPFIGKALTNLSKFLAAKRGLPMLAGAGLTILSAIVALIVMVIIVSSPDVGAIWLLLCIPGALLHLGIFLGLVGAMMSAPLGPGYGD